MSRPHKLRHRPRNSETQTAFARTEAAAAALVLEGSPARTATEGVAAETGPRVGGGRSKGAPELLPITGGGREPGTVGPPRPILRRIDPQFAAVDLLTVEALDGLGCFRFRRKFDEGKAPRPAGLSISTDVHVLDLPGPGEGVRKLLLRSSEI